MTTFYEHQRAMYNALVRTGFGAGIENAVPPELEEQPTSNIEFVGVQNFENLYDTPPELAAALDDIVEEDDIAELDHLGEQNERKVEQLENIKSAIQINANGSRIDVEDVVQLRTGAEAYLPGYRFKRYELSQAIEAINATQAGLIAAGIAALGTLIYKLFKWFTNRSSKGSSANSATDKKVEEVTEKYNKLAETPEAFDLSKIVSGEAVASQLKGLPNVEKYKQEKHVKMETVIKAVSAHLMDKSGDPACRKAGFIIQANKMNKLTTYVKLITVTKPQYDRIIAYVKLLHSQIALLLGKSTDPNAKIDRTLEDQYKEIHLMAKYLDGNADTADKIFNAVIASDVPISIEDIKNATNALKEMDWFADDETIKTLNNTISELKAIGESKDTPKDLGDEDKKLLKKYREEFKRVQELMQMVAIPQTTLQKGYSYLTKFYEGITNLCGSAKSANEISQS